METRREILAKLNKDELLDLIEAYDEYVTDYPESHDVGNYSACLLEFHDMEYDEYLEQKDNDVVKSFHDFLSFFQDEE